MSCGTPATNVSRLARSTSVTVALTALPSLRGPPDRDWNTLRSGRRPVQEDAGEPMHDLVIRGGTIVDGTGAAPRPGDVAVDDGRVTEVGRVDADAAQTLDATGCVVTPGFVDVHTHYDGQVTWDPTLAPSSWHGVTTLVMGNCGVGFAPVRPGAESFLIELMEGVEDIPGTAL